MKVIEIIILTFLLVACGKTPTKTNYQPPVAPTYKPLFSDSNLELSQIADEFYDEYYHQTGNVFNGELPPINFYDLKELSFLNPSVASQAMGLGYDLDFHYNAANNQTTMAGICLSYPGGEREILIDTTVWSTISQGFSCGGNNCYERRRALIYHELGHCALNRDHKDNKFQNYNLSIMNSVLLRQNDVVRWEDEYIEELFTEDHSHLQTKIQDYVNNN